MHALFFSAEPTHLHMHGSHEPMPEGQASRVEAGHNCSVKLGEWQVPGLHGFAQVRMDKHAFGPVMALTRVKQRGSLCRKPQGQDHTFPDIASLASPADQPPFAAWMCISRVHGYLGCGKGESRPQMVPASWFGNLFCIFRLDLSQLCAVVDHWECL